MRVSDWSEEGAVREGRLGGRATTLRAVSRTLRASDAACLAGSVYCVESQL